MKCNLLTAMAAALAMISAGAQASSSFTLEIRGGGEYGDYYTLPQPNGDPLWPVYWMGSLTVETASGGDGFYTGADLQSITFVTDHGDGFTFHAGDGVVTDVNDYGTFTYGMEPGASVTISGGLVTSVDFHYLWEFPGGTADGVLAEGLSIKTAGMMLYSPHGYDAELNGILTQVPEPANAALLLAGLLVTCTRIRAGRPSRQPCHSAR